MKVKKYVAPSMSEAMKKVRTELGNDAVILNSKVIYSGGFLGLFKKRSIEVIAAIDHAEEAAVKTVVKEKNRKIPEINHKEIQPAATAYGQIPVSFPAGSPEVLKELAELKSMMHTIQKGGTGSHTLKYPEPLQKMDDLLAKQEIEESIRSNAMQQLLEKWFHTNGSASEAQLTGWLGEILVSVIDYQIPEKMFDKKYINVVGPTGVGKTTTLAKIAALTILKQNKKVAFITTDTYRIAAIDQLKTYAKILNVPIEVAYNLEDFKKAAEKFAHYDTVFIDTAGRNFRNQNYVRDLKEIIDFERDMETYLVLALTAKLTDMEEIYRQFSIIPVKQVIFTKADETASYGSMVNFIHRNSAGVAYLTNGQNVPDDILEATPQSIIKTVLGVETT
ncbi:flagellar biosynthesis protein FlhF [Peribacillus saganii]|uniref:Flagellar biosynthesis protein FlhF n=1 Tax=Peribacillus saganii TaxID=2303992 RepID=A0A372LUQ9_9BACI|nr:flagellar biosynthesis protein FlhF [Peribacillus saganii]RFU71304.1 flagellar biosynthesis protein FlhF [Peribacillus saganii]